MSCLVYRTYFKDVPPERFYDDCSVFMTVNIMRSTNYEISLMHNKLFNTNIKSSHVLLTPNDLKTKLPLTRSAEETVLKFRQEIGHILDFQDSRKFIVVLSLLNS